MVGRRRAAQARGAVPLYLGVATARARGRGQAGAASALGHLHIATGGPLAQSDTRRLAHAVHSAAEGRGQGRVHPGVPPKGPYAGARPRAVRRARGGGG